LSDFRLNRSLKFLVSSIIWYWRANLGVLIGTAIATAVLAGALIVGDSVKQSLVNISMKRLGKTSYALEAGNKFLTAKLSDRLSTVTDITMAGVLHLPGIILEPDKQEELNNLQIYGIDDEFWQFSVDTGIKLDLQAGEVAINERVAYLLELEVGDRVILKLEQAIGYFIDTPIVNNEQRIQSLPVTIAYILEADQMGRFSLENNQIYPLNIFINRQYLVEKLEISDRTNLILAQDNLPDSNVRLTQAMSTSLTLEDIGLNIRQISETGAAEIISNSIFIPENYENIIRESEPGSRGILTYFVNSISIGTKTTPYSFVSGIERYESQELSRDEIIVSEWLARDLNIKVGDRIQLKYFIFDIDNSLVEESAFFTVSRIISSKSKQLNPNLTPLFPGLGDAETCFEWSPGIPIDLKLIRTEDEEYWDEYRSTPKALISLSAAQSLWSNRFGSLTTIRLSGDQVTDQLTQSILKNIVLAPSHLKFRPVYTDAIAASTQSVDFGQLFIGLSFFIILAAVLLIGLLFRFSIEQREEESTHLLALGFKLNQVKILYLIEAGMIALIGSLAGIGLGILYAKGLLYGLGTYWRSAVGFSDFQLSILPIKLMISSLIGTLLALTVVWSSLRKLRSKQDILQVASATVGPVRFRGMKWGISSLLFGMVIIVAFQFKPSVTENLTIFYLAGILLLIWATGFVLLAAHEISFKISKKKLNLRQLVIGNWYRRRGKNVTAIVMLALGIFVVILVGANFVDSARDGHLKSSGTGGFEYYAETSLNFPKQLKIQEVDAGSIVSLRKLVGDDASCLNLNFITQPQVLGVNPAELRDRFSFAKIAPDLDVSSSWDLLSIKSQPNIIPTIADQTVLQWGLMKGIGDTLFYLDDHGQNIGLLIVGSLKNSIFQGNLLISELNFVRHFATNGGYRVFLIDKMEETFYQKNISRKLSKYGLNVIPAIERLNEFYAVENTYLLIFLLLGGLGVLISTFGMSITVIRSVLSNRWELGLLQAIGFRKKTITGIIGAEHFANLLAGVLIGGISAFLATWPLLKENNNQYPLDLIGLILVSIILNGMLWIWIGVKISLKDDLISVISRER
jgi:putative ABC transport system permease protein